MFFLSVSKDSKRTVHPAFSVSIVQIMICRRRGVAAAAGAVALLLLLMTIAFSPWVHAQDKHYTTAAQWKTNLSQQGNIAKSNWFSRWYVCTPHLLSKYIWCSSILRMTTLTADYKHSICMIIITRRGRFNTLQ